MRPPLASKDVPFTHAFAEIMQFHFPKECTIWDPTYGEGLSWRSIKENQHGFLASPLYHMTEEDIAQGQNILDAEYRGAFDGVYFDPPYIWGLKQSKDEREKTYGEYTHNKIDLQNFIWEAAEIIYQALKRGGKLVFKYTDVFAMDDRQFHFGAQTWRLPFPKFYIIDHFIIQHHHISPTAYQVKDRPCSICNHSYLTVMQKGK